MRPLLRRATAWLARWLDDVALGASSVRGLFRRARKLLLVEQADGMFALRAARAGGAVREATGAPLRFVDGIFTEGGGAKGRSRLAGAEVEIVLATRRFLFRPLELPAKAAGFLDAIARAQIDRLTPWNPAQAAFGCGAPTPLPGERVGVTIAATSRASVMPLVTALEALAPESIIVSAALDDTDPKLAARVVVFTQPSQNGRRLRQSRRLIVATPILAGLVALAAMAGWFYVAGELEATTFQVSRRMAERRASISHARGGVADDAAAKLAQEKRAAAPRVVLLESLSRALPDDTYLTELQIADGKLQMTGVTREASSLIKIVEQTDPFERATFFAPTTPATAESGEQFHIEAQIAPHGPEVR